MAKRMFSAVLEKAAEQIRGYFARRKAHGWLLRTFSTPLEPSCQKSLLANRTSDKIPRATLVLTIFVADELVEVYLSVMTLAVALSQAALEDVVVLHAKFGTGGVEGHCEYDGVLAGETGEILCSWSPLIRPCEDASSSLRQWAGSPLRAQLEAGYIPLSPSGR